MPGYKRKTPSEASGSRKRHAIGRSTLTNVPVSQKKGATLPWANALPFFSLLETTLRKNDLFNCPTHCYNMNESGLPLYHKPAKVITLKGSKKVHRRTSGDKTQVTILACGNCSWKYDSSNGDFPREAAKP